MSEPPARSRLHSIDTLRGLVIVLMILDHARDFFGPTPANPEVIGAANVPLFFTRWVTHFCAPVFVFLAGISAALRASNERPDRMPTSRFLVMRGLWLILLELTVIFMAWTFALPFWNQAGFFTNVILLQVIWALGVAMVALAPFTRAPRGLALAVGLIIVVGHEAFDTTALEQGINWTRFTTFMWYEKLWAIAHVGPIAFFVGDVTVFNVYPIVPWIGVILLGWSAAPLFLTEPDQRRKSFLRWGITITLAFLLVRATCTYGDPSPAVFAGTAWERIVSFLNTAKYPPSLHYLLMTLGPMFLVLWFFERSSARCSVLWTFGRVPLFLYIVHIPLVNALGALYFQGRFGIDRWQMGLLLPTPTYAFEIWPVYLGWAIVIAVLFIPCRAYGNLKHRSRHPAFQWL